MTLWQSNICNVNEILFYSYSYYSKKTKDCQVKKLLLLWNYYRNHKFKRKIYKFVFTMSLFVFCSGGHVNPDSWEPVEVQNLVRRCPNLQFKATFRWRPWESALCQGASPTQTQPQRAASGCPEQSSPVRRGIKLSSSAPTAGPPWSPYMKIHQ